jgi:hypothetical protein
MRPVFQFAPQVDKCRRRLLGWPPGLRRAVTDSAVARASSDTMTFVAARSAGELSPGTISGAARLADRASRETIVSAAERKARDPSMVLPQLTVGYTAPRLVLELAACEYRTGWIRESLPPRTLSILTPGISVPGVPRMFEKASATLLRTALMPYPIVLTLP